MAGANVRCPACKTVFQAPAAVPQAAPVAPVAVPVASPVPPAAAPAGAPFDFGSGGPPTAPDGGNAFAALEEHDSTRRGRGRARAAAFWINRAFTVLIALPSIAVMIRLVTLAVAGVPFPNQLLFITANLVILGVLLCLPLIFMGLGTRALQQTSSLGLAITGGVFAILTGTVAGLLALAALVGFVSMVSGGGLMQANALAFLAPPFLGIIAFSCIYAGVQALMAIADPEVREAFRRRREQIDARQRP